MTFRASMFRVVRRAVSRLLGIRGATCAFDRRGWQKFRPLTAAGDAAAQRPCQLAFLILALSAAAAPASSEWDETQLQLLQQYSTPLRWYNVEGAPYWVAGPKPHQPFGRRLHLIE